MTFNSIQYFVFFAIVCGGFWGLRQLGVPHRVRNFLLLIASYVFYGWWDWRFLSLLWISTIVDYLVGGRLHRTEDPKKRKRLLWVSITVNLGILGVFKYFNFFYDSFQDLLGELGISFSGPALHVILPVGVSFYTFQTLSYALDIYLRRMEPTDSPLDFALFVAYFPQLVAGPIERARELLPQLSIERPPLTKATVNEAYSLILMGLFKKVVIADGLAGFVDDVFKDPGDFGWLTSWAALFALALQVYCDFAGYTDIARGSSKLFGIDLMENFRQPFRATTFSNMWNRWHISLTSWIRDYVFFPLGGSHGNERKVARNLLLVYLAVGLWHGARWTFVIWGFINGLWIVAEREWIAWRKRRGYQPPEWRSRMWAKFLGPIYVMTTFCTLGVFFRAQSASAGWEQLYDIFTLQSGPVEWGYLLTLALASAAVWYLDQLEITTQKETEVGELDPGDRIQTIRWTDHIRNAVFIVLILVYSGETAVPFIYFEF